MRTYLDDDFLLHSTVAARLYHEHAAPLPIIDYHCHVDPRAVAEDRSFDDIADLWVTNDPYKWRAMRINGIPEATITGAASAYERFAAWARTVPYTVGNPLFHWTGLELKRYFGIDIALAPETAEAIWRDCNAQLRRPDSGLTARGILARTKVECLCTSDDLLDSLEWHRAAAARVAPPRMLPSLRADSIVAVDEPDFPSWVRRLSDIAARRIATLDDFKAAVLDRLDHFHRHGCRFADHGLDQPVFAAASDSVAAAVFARLMDGAPPSPHEREQLRTNLLLFLGAAYHARDWAMQLHIGAQRTTSSRLRALAGPAGGYACIGRSSDVERVCLLLNALEDAGALPRTILYTLNPADNDMYASLTGSFTEDGVPGKVQFGPAWWWNDHQEGIVRHFKVLCSLGLISRFIGMTTDSRSLLSYSRHEYFRRILCDQIGALVERGEMPNDDALLQRLVTDLCYANAKRWVG
jgi:glucuronate isomerase